MKFNHPGGSITVTLTQRQDNFEITVANTGIGIPKGKQAFIFERFSQLDASSTRKYEGTGIGLALTKEIIQLHQGSIDVDSSPGRGARYTFVDTDAHNRTTYYYLLEDIDLDGTSTLHDPVSATPRLINGLMKQ